MKVVKLMAARVPDTMHRIYYPVRILLLTLLIVSGAISTYAHCEKKEPFPREKVVVYGDGSPGPYNTGRRFIGGTLEIESPLADSLTVEGTNDYEGTVTFNRPVGVDDSVSISFAVPPAWLKETYTRPKSEEIRRQGLKVSYDNYREKTPQHFPGLTFSGSKTFDINFGNERETALNQTLRLNIAGKLTDDITINITGYFRDIRNLSGTRATEIEVFPGFARYSKIDNSDFGFVRGITFAFNKRFSGGLSASVDYTLQQAKGTNSDPEAAQKALAGGALPEVQLTALDWDQQHTINATLSYAAKDWGGSVFMGLILN